jgi:hypothetical protein
MSSNCIETFRSELNNLQEQCLEYVKKGDKFKRIYKNKNGEDVWEAASFLANGNDQYQYGGKMKKNIYGGGKVEDINVCDYIKQCSLFIKGKHTNLQKEITNVEKLYNDDNNIEGNTLTESIALTDKLVNNILEFQLLLKQYENEINMIEKIQKVVAAKSDKIKQKILNNESIENAEDMIMIEELPFLQRMMAKLRKSFTKTKGGQRKKRRKTRRQQK